MFLSKKPLAFTLLIITLVLPGEAQQIPSPQPSAGPPPAASSISLSASPKTTGTNENDDAVPALPGMQIFQGSGAFVENAKVKDVTNKAGNVTLDFTDTDIRDVVRAIFGDILQKSYTLDPKVTGKITLKTGRPIPKDAVIPALETALKVNGAAINLSQDIYNIVPLTDAQRRGQISYGSDEAQAAGYGIEIVSLQFVSAEEMQRIITPLVPETAIAQIDTRRNLIFLAGTEPEREAIRDTIARFDVNYLKGMSFALIQPTHADVDTLASELSKIFDEANSPIAGLVRIVPIARINSLLVTTSRPSYLREVQRWVGRLDVAPVTPDRKLYYRRLQNARARDVAEVLGRLFGTSQSTGSSGGDYPDMVAATRPTFAPMSSGSSSPTSSTLGGIVPQQQSSLPRQAPPANLAKPATAGSSGPQVVTDESNNALIIRADTADYAALDEVIKEMDVAPNQVMVEATIVEVTLNDTLKYGVEWYFKNANETYTLAKTGKVSTSFPGLGITYSVSNIQAALSTLGALTNVTVLSSPKILTLDNKTATIEVGDQIPVVTQTSVSTTSGDSPIVSSVSQRDTGVILSVTPRIGNSGLVYLEVSQEVSSSTPTTSSGIDSPTIQQRRIQSTVAVNDGATIALGGLMQRSETRDDSGIPYLKDIPLLGAAFSTKSNMRTRTELLVFLTPHVIRNLPSALDITEKLKHDMEDIRNAMDEVPTHRVPRRPW